MKRLPLFFTKGYQYFMTNWDGISGPRCAYEDQDTRIVELSCKIGTRMIALDSACRIILKRMLKE